ncbi:MAG TPA: preprotein translocase subunit YajC [Longimicrobiaceae bacterium]|nr:preprotein translocase subunit YajC [Longimicrobiaceae bacterium]
MLGLALQMAGGPGMGLIIQLVIVFGIMYFLLIMPQRREQKRHREMVAALKTGDEVLTAGGVIGEIIAIKEERVTLKSGDARLVVDRARVARKLNA